MVKKFSYLVSVSVLAGSLLSSASHAVYDDELRDVINSFCVQQQSHPAQVASSSSPSSDDGSSPLWSTVWSSILSGTGHSLRYLGDTVRGDSFAGDVLTKNALSLAGTGCKGASETIDAVKADESALKSLRKTGGNALRYAGALMAGETPTLERAIRQFWLDKRVVDVEEVFTSTACALYRSQLSGVDEIKLNYNKFISNAWNPSSYTIPSLDVGKNVEYFLKGIIRGFVMNGQSMSTFDSIDPHMAALGITYENLPVTKAITVKKLPEDTHEARLAQARQEAFMDFVESIHSLETLKKQTDQVRLTSLQVPSALPAVESHPTLLAIEYHQ
jgi:hypothetical protein